MCRPGTSDNLNARCIAFLQVQNLKFFFTLCVDIIYTRSFCDGLSQVSAESPSQTVPGHLARSVSAMGNLSVEAITEKRILRHEELDLATRRDLEIANRGRQRMRVLAQETTERVEKRYSKVKKEEEHVKQLEWSKSCQVCTSLICILIPCILSCSFRRLCALQACRSIHDSGAEEFCSIGVAHRY